MNKIIIIGNLGRDPEMRYTQNGSAVTSFSVASNRKYTTREGERRDETEWFNCSAWGKLAETVQQYLQKGSKVYVEGRLTTRQYQTQSGENRTSIDVMLTEIQFLDSRSDQGDRNQEPRGYYNQGNQSSRSTAYEDAVDDLPF